MHACRRAALRRGRHTRRGSDICPACPMRFNLSSTATIIKSPALNAPSSQSASPRRPESVPSRSRMRSSTASRRSAYQVLSRSRNRVVCEIKDRRLNRVDRCKHPCDRARPGIRIVRQQAGMTLCDMEHDCPRFEQDKIAFFIGRNLPERMKRSMRGFLHRTERNKTNLVRLAHFFKRSANAHVTRQSLAAIGRLFKGSNGGDHWIAPTNDSAPIRQYRSDRVQTYTAQSSCRVSPGNSASLKPNWLKSRMRRG